MGMSSRVTSSASTVNFTGARSGVARRASFSRRRLVASREVQYRRLLSPSAGVHYSAALLCVTSVCKIMRRLKTSPYLLSGP